MPDQQSLGGGSGVMEMQEIEIKLAVGEVGRLRSDLFSLGFRVAVPRFHELNLVFDTRDKDLARRRCLLRLRRGGVRNVLTAKAPSAPGRDHPGYKVRRETEVLVSDFDATRLILENSGFEVVFTYEKFREILEGRGVHVMLDETPAGNFIEIEGEPSAIDRLALDMGFRKEDYITANYRTLFLAGGGTGDMLFPQSRHESGKG